MSKYIVKLDDKNRAKPHQIVCGFLGNIFGDGKIAEYDMLEASKKANLFGGAIERVSTIEKKGKTFKFNSVKHNAWKRAIPKDQILIDIPNFYEEVEPKENQGYSIYLMMQLAIEHTLITVVEYDLMWENAEAMLNEFTGGEFDDEDKSEYDCIVEFLTNKEKED